MRTQLIISPEPIAEAARVAERAGSPEAGAAVYFTGCVRGREDEQPIQALAYETFQQMAKHQFELIFREIEKRWPILSLRVIHRVGVVTVGEASLWAEVVAPHRQEAFAACQYLIDEMKRRVPIWKKPIPGPSSKSS